jgi:hypothetical protein
MTNKRDLAVLQFIAVVVIFFTAICPGVIQFFSHYIPYAEVVIPAGAFVLLFQALSLIYTHYLWKLHPGTAYLGGQWIYQTVNKTKNEKKTDDDPDSSDKQYGIFEIIHTTDELRIYHGEAWNTGTNPSVVDSVCEWVADTIVYRNETLGIMGSVDTQQTQLGKLTVIRRESETEMTGTIWRVADQDTIYHGHTKMKKIGDRPRKDAAQEAYRIFGSS